MCVHCINLDIAANIALLIFDKLIYNIVVKNIIGFSFAITDNLGDAISCGEVVGGVSDADR